VPPVRRTRWTAVPLAVTFAFLYLPIVVLVVMAFNASSSPFSWGGPSLRWFGELAGDTELVRGLLNTLLVAALSTVLSVVLGGTLALGLHRYTRSSLLDAFALSPAVVPDLVLGIGLLAMVSLAGLRPGLPLVVAAHVVFGTAFVAAVVKARLAHTDPSLEEASRDLGAAGWTTFRLVTVPLLAPALVAGALLQFTLSVDEFVIAFFTNGPTSPTLPIVIYSRVRFGVTPEINALAVVLLVVSFAAVIGARRLYDPRPTAAPTDRSDA
jgi:spermidine/putrescine transport system permease protein